MKTVLFIGATGQLGKPVALEFLKAGFRVKALVRRPNLAIHQLPKEIELVKGDVFDRASLERAIEPGDIIYLNFSVKPEESPSQMKTDREGVENVLAVARTKKASRVIYLASLVQKYQGMNGFDWWVFKLKIEAEKKIRASGVPYSIFYPSTFMDNFLGHYKRGNKIALAGKSHHKMWFIAAEDYGKQVVRSLDLDSSQNYEFTIQGREGFTADEAAQIFVKHYKKEKLKIMKAPMLVFKILSPLVRSMNYLNHIMTALNEYPEQFESQETWKVLGEPRVTLKDFAERG